MTETAAEEWNLK